MNTSTSCWNFISSISHDVEHAIIESVNEYCTLGDLMLELFLFFPQKEKEMELPVMAEEMKKNRNELNPEN